uniref:Uncharacterized protein n=1 Tax=Myoviridae sp. ctCL221 TaxID=2826630 RepID=A0A8S5M6L7_9CAUD|nr:MAG TPA: hypothetical protein [Myoviridae sp. ctCL221]
MCLCLYNRKPLEAISKSIYLRRGYEVYDIFLAQYLAYFRFLVLLLYLTHLYLIKGLF